MTHIEREKKTVGQMVRIYCRAKHGGSELCEQCAGLLAYCHARLDRCRFGERKPTCKKCTVHCYMPARRTEIRRVMSFAGPRMLLHHPLAAIRHLLQ